MIAVFDIGKTNLKLHLIDQDGRLVADRSRPNRAVAASPWLQADLASIEQWLLASLAEFAATYPIEAFVTACHGSGGALVDDAGPVLPPIDYEGEVPAAIARDYAAMLPPFAEHGATIQGNASHFAQQLLMMQRLQPERFATARRFLPFPQYWAWRLTGDAVLEPTMLGAQSHLRNPFTRELTGLAAANGWTRLLPEIAKSYTVVGTPRPELGLPATMRVLAGIHDSTANLYCYQAAGYGDVALLSTGTWIVGMSPSTPQAAVDERYGMSVTSSVDDEPVVGVLAMTGREYGLITGGHAGRATPEALAAVIGKGIMVLPGFVDFDGVFPGSAGRGRIEGEPADQAEIVAAATLYAALVADVCLDLLQSRNRVAVDGGFTADPAFAGLVAALRPGQDVLVNRGGGGTAAGAALLWTHRHLGLPVRLDIAPAEPLALFGLKDYRRRWRRATAGHIGRPLPRSCSQFDLDDQEEKTR